MDLENRLSAAAIENPKNRKPMPIEVRLLEGQPVKMRWCPICGAAPFIPFMRGQVQRGRRGLFGLGKQRGYCALICSACHGIADYESPL